MPSLTVVVCDPLGHDALQVKRGTNAGTFRLKHKLLFIANALKQHHIGLEETDDGITLVRCYLSSRSILLPISPVAHADTAIGLPRYRCAAPSPKHDRKHYHEKRRRDCPRKAEQQEPLGERWIEIDDGY